jgi:hypothetical protein
MSSNGSSDRVLLDLDRDLPTTDEDVRVLRALRRQVPGWLELGYEEIDAILPVDALARRPPTPADRRPFSLE